MEIWQIFKRDEKDKENAPEVIKEEIQDSKDAAKPITFENLMALGRLENVASGGHASDPVAIPGQKFGVPDLPLAPMSHLHYRYDPVVSQVTNLLMKDGKLSVAQRVRSPNVDHPELPLCFLSLVENTNC